MASQQVENAQKYLKHLRQLNGVDAPLSTDSKPEREPIFPSPELPESPPKKQTLPARVKIYPTIAKAFLEHFPGVGRVYDLLKAYDIELQGGRGLVSEQDARKILDFMTWRNLRIILAQGEGVCWARANGNIYLSSPARVALALDAGILRGKPVWVEVQDLTSGIRKVRAAYYSATIAGQTNGNPITRQALRKLTGVAERTQQDYDRVAGTKRKANLAVSNKTYSKENRERLAWERGKNTFRFYDHQGKHTRKGGVTIAWRLPNSYVAKHEIAPKGRQRKHNKTINLVIKREQGNSADYVRFYHPFASQAAKAVSREPEHDHYYSVGDALMPSVDNPPKLAPVTTWGVVSYA